MATIHFFRIAIFVLLVIVNINCVKESTSLVVLNTSPKANAGLDRQVVLSTNSCLLEGSVYDNVNSIQKVLWKKVSGPASFYIDNPNSFSTTVKNLEPGEYQFELTVINKLGFYGKDTLRLTVSQLLANREEIFFGNLTWIPIWYETLEINNINSFIPAGTPFRVYIQRDANPAWIEATPAANDGSGGSYEYFIETRPDGGGMYTYGSLYVFGYGTDFNDTPNVKIVF